MGVYWLWRTRIHAAASASSARGRQPGASGTLMKKEAMRSARPRPADGDEQLLPEYDFRGGVRGKYAAQFAESTNVVLLDPDLAQVFRTAADVNRALRKLV